MTRRRAFLLCLGSANGIVYSMRRIPLLISASFFLSSPILLGMNAGPGVLVWTASAYTASNVNGSAPATDSASTTNPLVFFDVMNDPNGGSYINSSPAVTTQDFSAGGLEIDHNDPSSGVASITMLNPNLPLAGVSFVIADLDSDNTTGKLDGVVVSATTDTGATVFPLISAGSQLSITGTPGEVVSMVGPNTGQDDANTQALFIFNPSTYITKINVEYANFGTLNNDQHMSISDISWQSTTPEPSSALLVSIVGMMCINRRQKANS